MNSFFHNFCCSRIPRKTQTQNQLPWTLKMNPSVERWNILQFHSSTSGGGGGGQVHFHFRAIGGFAVMEILFSCEQTTTCLHVQVTCSLRPRRRVCLQNLFDFHFLISTADGIYVSNCKYFICNLFSNSFIMIINYLHLFFVCICNLFAFEICLHL